jgi:hypothetical protein
MNSAVPAGFGVAIAVWHTCWTIGRVREDQELKESGPVVASVVSFVAVTAANLAFPPTIRGEPVGFDILIEWSLAQAGLTALTAIILLTVFEYGIWADFHDHEGLLLGLPIEERDRP